MRRRFKKNFSFNRKPKFNKKIMSAVALLLVIGVATTFGLVGCREMSQEDVVGRLSSNLEENKSYLATGVMEVESEGQIHVYAIEIGFAYPAFYRVTMRNEATGNEQVILKNDDGVFVLTPALNKQFKFQSDWPLTSSQVYLYQSLLLDILNAEAQTTEFVICDDFYTFTIPANYQANTDLTSQIMQFDRKNLTPALINVVDSGGTPRLTMQFLTFEWNSALAPDFFVAEAIMELAQDVMGDAVVITVADVYDAQLYPRFVPEGSQLIDRTRITTANGERVILTFAGEHEFTIIQESARVRDVLAPELILGEPIMVNGTVAAISDNTLTWQRNGVEFFLVSQTLDREQLVTVASSIVEAYDK